MSALSVLPAVLSVALAAAGPLDEGIARYQALDFEKATIAFQTVVDRPELDAPTRAQGYLWLALCYGQLDNMEQVQRSIERALKADPQVQVLPDTPPRIAAMLADARAKLVGAKRDQRSIVDVGDKIDGDDERTTSSTTTDTPPPPPPSLVLPAALVGGGVVCALGAAALGVLSYAEYTASQDLELPFAEANQAYAIAVASGVGAAAAGVVAVGLVVGAGALFAE